MLGVDEAEGAGGGGRGGGPWVRPESKAGLNSKLDRGSVAVVVVQHQVR